MRLICFDASAKAKCSNWTTPQVPTAGPGRDWYYNGRSFFWRDSAGNETMICVMNQPEYAAAEVYCYDRDTGALLTNPTDVNAMVAYYDGANRSYGIGVGPYWHEPTNRLLINAGSGHGSPGGGGTNDWVVCWDFETQGGCGVIDTTVAGGARTYGYGYEEGSRCVLALGDWSWFWSFFVPHDTPIEQGCRGGTASVDIDPCQCHTGDVHWGSVSIDVDLALTGPYEEFIVTVTAPNGQELINLGNLVGTNTANIDLAEIPTTYSHLTITLEVLNKPGSNPWEDGDPPKITVGWVDKPSLTE